MKKFLTYEEAYKFALANYEEGGDVFVECWDRQQFDEYIRLFGPLSKSIMKKMFKMWDDEYKEQQAMFNH